MGASELGEAGFAGKPKSDRQWRWGAEREREEGGREEDYSPSQFWDNASRRQHLAQFAALETDDAVRNSASKTSLPPSPIIAVRHWKFINTANFPLD
jgi:hypothetical protein